MLMITCVSLILNLKYYLRFQGVADIKKQYLFLASQHSL